jgi:hypothetical protein
LLFFVSVGDLGFGVVLEPFVMMVYARGKIAVPLSVCEVLNVKKQ